MNVSSSVFIVILAIAIFTPILIPAIAEPMGYEPVYYENIPDWINNVNIFMNELPIPVVGEIIGSVWNIFIGTPVELAYYFEQSLEVMLFLLFLNLIAVVSFIQLFRNLIGFT